MVMLASLLRSRPNFTKNVQNLLLLCLASVLFYLSFPSTLFRFGLGFLSFFCLVPVFLLVHRNSFRSLPMWGFLYGFLTYMLFNSWLFTFSPNTFFVVPFIYGMYFFFFFPLLKIVHLVFKRYAFLVFLVFWVSYEYLRTTGFLGYSFGVIGYGLSFYPALVQLADVFGVWMLCVLVVFPSCLVYQGIVGGCRSWKDFLRQRVLFWSSMSFVFLLLVHLLYGVFSRVDYSDAKTQKVSLVQHVVDPWKGGQKTYEKSLDILSDLSRRTIEEENPDLLVWSETAFVPSIDYHLRYKENKNYVKIINKLLRFLEKYPDTYFLIGNGEGKRYFDENNKPYREDYNASILFQGRERKESYYKIHLVPFTEYFPYKKSLAWIYKILKELDVHFWKAGTEHTVFRTPNLRFSTPICFEDGFGHQNALFVQQGAEFFINITNDAWSGVEVNAMQHLQLSILRSVENRRSMLRATNSGMTAAIDPNGVILSLLPSFTMDVLTVDVPIDVSRKTLYTWYPDYFAYLCLLVSSFLLLYAIIICMQSRRKLK